MHILYPFSLSEQMTVHSDVILGLSKQINVHLSFLHVELFQSDQEEELKKNRLWKTTFVELLEGLKQRQPTFSYSIYWEQGLLVETILDKAVTLQVDLIWMLTSGKDRPSYQGIHLQSSTQAVIEKASVPVWVYPLKTEFTPIREVALALDIFKFDETKVKQAIELLSPFGASIELIYISGILGALQYDKAKEVEAYWKSMYSNCSLTLLESEDVNATLENYSDSKGIDVVVLFKTKKSLIEKLFGGSFTHQVSYYAAMPILVLK